MWAPNTILRVLEKTNEPILRKLTDERTDGRTDGRMDGRMDRLYFTGPGVQ